MQRRRKKKNKWRKMLRKNDYDEVNYFLLIYFIFYQVVEINNVT
jgi:hypothetical protein